MQLKWQATWSRKILILQLTLNTPPQTTVDTTIHHWLLAYRFNSPHSKVIVVLLRQLFRAQFVHLNHLTGKILAGFKSLRVQDNFSNKAYSQYMVLLDISVSLTWVVLILVPTIVRDHHCKRSEERLEVVWKLSSTSIARIHGHKCGARGN